MVGWLADPTMELAWCLQHIIHGVWWLNSLLLRSAMRPFCRFLPSAASCSPLFFLLLNYCYLPAAVLRVRLLIFSLVETRVVVAVLVRSGVVEVCVALHLAPLAP